MPQINQTAGAVVEHESNKVIKDESIVAGPAAVPKARANPVAPRQINLLSLQETSTPAQVLEHVRLGEDDMFVIPFTAMSVEVPVHYCGEKEISSYVTCNGDGCVLCRIGKKRDTKILLPVYLPTERRIGVLPMSHSFRPGALLPQMLTVLKSGVRSVVIIRRHNYQYEVVTKSVPDGTDDGAAQIRTFNEDYEAGRVDLSAGFQRIDNQSLARCEQIAQKLRYQGVADDKGGRN